MKPPSSIASRLLWCLLILAATVGLWRATLPQPAQPPPAPAPAPVAPQPALPPPPPALSPPTPKVPEPPVQPSAPPFSGSVPGLGGETKTPPPSSAQNDNPDAATTDLAARMSAALDEPDVEVRTATWNKLLAGMRLSDAKSVRAIFLENDKRGRWYVPEWIAFWGKYGELSTAGALDEWQATGDYRDADSPGQLVAAAIKARGLPEAQMLLERDDVRESAVMIEALFRTVARIHPEQSIPFMLKSVPEVLRPQAAKAIAEISISRSGLEQAGPLMQRLRDAGAGVDPQQAAFSAMLEAAWRGGPERVQEFALSHVRQPWCTGIALGSVSAQLVGENASSAMDFVTRLPEDLEREKLETCVDMAVDQSLRLNPDDIGRWLLDHPKARHYDHITASYCQALSMVDPVAAESWARTVQDPALRSKALPPKDG